MSVRTYLLTKALNTPFIGPDRRRLADTRPIGNTCIDTAPPV
jgi:hypothetical protein